MIWISLLIPLLGAVVLLIWFREKLTWWEIFLPTLVCLVFTGIFKFTVEKCQVSDTEYWGTLGRRAEYYEPWSTWVDQTCTRQVACGTDSKGNTKYCTETYDCSYCDNNGPEWYLIGDDGTKIRIPQEKFEELKVRWNATPKFEELNRDIDYSGGCGEDGDKYVITWDEKPLTSEPITSEHTYENRVQAAHTAFDFAEVSPEEAKLNGLYEYSEVTGYKQKTVLGLDSIQWMNPNDKLYLEKMIDYNNGEMGARKQARIWALFFQDKPAVTANLQEAYWKGGNKNEMIICVGLSSHTNWVQWVRPFSWTTNRTLLVDLREDLIKTGKFSGKAFSQVIRKDMERFERKEFKEFSYITVDPPFWAIVTTFIITIIITVACCWWAVVNETETNKSWERRRY